MGNRFALTLSYKNKSSPLVKSGVIYYDMIDGVSDITASRGNAMPINISTGMVGATNGEA